MNKPRFMKPKNSPKKLTNQQLADRLVNAIMKRLDGLPQVERIRLLRKANDAMLAAREREDSK